jgi:glycosyltransferase involved in cell wall biosynthesis
MMEAFAAEIPVMSTQVGAVSEIVNHGVNGILLEANPAPEAIYEQLKSFLQMDDHTRESFQKEAKATWEAKFSAKRNYGKFVSDLLALESP